MPQGSGRFSRRLPPQPAARRAVSDRQGQLAPPARCARIPRMSAPRILLVDDQRQVSRMLRASLELSGHDYNVADVASAEEALIELARGPIDLLVTDLRLPGMSGLELLAKVRLQNPQARAILITGAPTDEIAAEATALGVIAFLRKPLGTSFFLEAVARALEVGVTALEPEEAVEGERPRIAERLAELRRELGAEAAFLVGDNGRVLARAGDLVNLDLDATLPPLMAAFSAGLKVSQLMGTSMPGNLQYFSGPSYDFYMTNVGAAYCLLMAFTARPEAGQMGAVVHFGRRAASDLLAALSSLGVIEPDAKAEAPLPPSPSPVEPVREVSARELASAARKVGRKDVETYWDDAVADAKDLNPAEGDALSYEQARRLGLLPEDPEPKG
ncbi:MAG: response regulator [Chloroflexi bacterium]|nr:response regulator [Chloroflexota bacterium]